MVVWTRPNCSTPFVAFFARFAPVKILSLHGYRKSITNVLTSSPEKLPPTTYVKTCHALGNIEKNAAIPLI